MNEEEKKAYDILLMLKYFTQEKEDKQAIITILELVDRQQKEIEALEDKNKTLESLLQGNLYELYLCYKEIANEYQANCISKDKIREKIKELLEEKYE